jgi:hypothetical protein
MLVGLVLIVVGLLLLVVLWLYASKDLEKKRTSSRSGNAIKLRTNN